MTKHEAMLRYMQANPKALQMVERIMRWDPKTNLIGNTVICNFESTACSGHFARKFGLKHIGKVGAPKK